MRLRVNGREAGGFYVERTVISSFIPPGYTNSLYDWNLKGAEPHNLLSLREMVRNMTGISYQCQSESLEAVTPMQIH